MVMGPHTGQSCTSDSATEAVKDATKHIANALIFATNY